jgi:hypothetical protein
MDLGYLLLNVGFSDSIKNKSLIKERRHYSLWNKQIMLYNLSSSFF